MTRPAPHIDLLAAFAEVMGHPADDRPAPYIEGDDARAEKRQDERTGAAGGRDLDQMADRAADRHFGDAA